jgi:metal-responsive CopG/Arc/MetJ family transcriptional regulator
MPARTTRNISITMPVAMAKDASRLAKRERRTMSELFREALRHYQASRQKPNPDNDLAWVMGIIEDAKKHPMSPARLEAEDKLLREYGARKARSRKLTDEDIVRIIHESRAERNAA